MRGPGPVFVVGCPRSGTTLLYHTLISAGGFVDYPAESHVFNLFAARYGSFADPRVREAFLPVWLKTHYFEKTGLRPEPISRRLRAEAESWGDFLRIVMEEMARVQGVGNWAECTPHHALHLREIARDLPDARVIHMIRDGRDVALSMDRLGWAPRLPGDRSPSVLAAGAYWSWILRRGRSLGRSCGLPYTEVSFEELVQRPGETLDELGTFLHRELSYDEVLRNPVGSVANPNTSFGVGNGAGVPDTFDPVARWRRGMAQELQQAFMRRFGDLLDELGYEDLTSPGRSLYDRVYSAFLSSKQWAKTRTPLGRVMTRTLMGGKEGTVRDVMEPGS